MAAIKQVLNKLERLESYGAQRDWVDKIAKEYGNEVANLNFLIWLINANRTKKTIDSSVFQFSPSSNQLFEIAGSQQPSQTLEVTCTQPKIVIFKSKHLNQQIALQIEEIQILMNQEIASIFSIYLKIFYFFDFSYPPTLVKFFQFWEKVLEYGTQGKYATQTVANLVNLMKD